MLWIDIDFPHTKVVNLIEEFTDFLEENSLEDEREYHRTKIAQIDDSEAGDDEVMPDRAFVPELDMVKSGKKKSKYQDVLKNMIAWLE